MQLVEFSFCLWLWLWKCVFFSCNSLSACIYHLRLISLLSMLLAARLKLIIYIRLRGQLDEVGLLFVCLLSGGHELH